MARIIVIGGGVVGMTGALLLGRDGHDVTVLERDRAPAPDPEAAWTDWDRKGVNQFRMLHYFAPRFTQLMKANAPDVVDGFDKAGALLVNPLRDAPAEVTGGFRDEDARFDAVTARRPVAEAVIASIVAQTGSVTVQRGVSVTGLLTADSTNGDIPRVVGVRTDAGDDLRADLVVDAGGRRSTLPKLLTDIGARAPIEEKEDCGFIYWGRHFRSNDGSVPYALGPLLAAYGTVSILTLPSDNGTWGVGFVTSAKDTAMRALKDVDVWTRVVKQYPLAAHWLDGEPIDDGVAIMAKIEDRHRTFVIDGQPVAEGVLALGDSWAATNPSVGRGVSIGAIHAVALRDFLRNAPDDGSELARGWHDATLASVEGWYRGTLAFDQGRLEQIHAGIEDRPFEPEPAFEITSALQASAGKDPELFRAFLDIAGVLALPDEVLARPGVFERVVELGSGWRDEALPAPTCEELLATVAG